MYLLSSFSCFLKASACLFAADSQFLSVQLFHLCDLESFLSLDLLELFVTTFLLPIYRFLTSAGSLVCHLVLTFFFVFVAQELTVT